MGLGPFLILSNCSHHAKRILNSCCEKWCCVPITSKEFRWSTVCCHAVLLVCCLLARINFRSVLDLSFSSLLSSLIYLFALSLLLSLSSLSFFLPCLSLSSSCSSLFLSLSISLFLLSWPVLGRNNTFTLCIRTEHVMKASSALLYVHIRFLF